MTSVQWLIEQLRLIRKNVPSYIIEKAEEMHKQEIIEAVNLPKEDRWYDAKLYNSPGEKYYTETYISNMNMVEDDYKYGDLIEEKDSKSGWDGC